MQQDKAKIFLAEERGHAECDWFRTRSTFNYGAYFNAHKNAFGALYVLNDETLAAGKSLAFDITTDTCVLLIPIVGAIACSDGATLTWLQAGEAQLLQLTANSSFKIANPFETESINFMHVWIKSSRPYVATESWLETFDLTRNPNKLLPLFGQVVNTGIAVAIGKFDGRSEAVYKAQPGKDVFVFVLEGAFEVQHRLLHARDGLAFWQASTLEFEALSNEAIILFIECAVD